MDTFAIQILINFANFNSLEFKSFCEENKVDPDEIVDACDDIIEKNDNQR